MSLGREAGPVVTALPEGPPTRPWALEVDQLEVHYPRRRGVGDRLGRRAAPVVRAVDGVSLRVAPGEFLALVGESGCGKTTTVRAILRAVRPTAGSIKVGGVDVSRYRQREMRSIQRRMQMVYQDPYESLDPRFRIRETLEEPLAVHRVGSKEQRRQRALDTLERAGLSPAGIYLDRYPHELSGGQRQRVAIAAALVLEPTVLLADEPVSMLDVSVRAGVLNLLGSLRQDGAMSIVMVTHDLSTAGHFSDRIVVMYLGRVVEEGPTRDVLASPRHPYTKALLSVVPKRDPRQKVPAQILSGETPSALSIPSGCRFRPRCPLAEASCAEIDPVLAPPRRGGAAPGHQVACILA